MIISNSALLDAVNQIIGSIGSPPVNSLEDVSNVDVENAIRLLNKNVKTVLQTGWTFNSYKDYEINPDLFEKKILWNNSWLSLVGTDNNYYVKRGEYLYNLTGNTMTFTGSITVDLIVLLDFEDLPPVMQTYITAQTASEFQTKYLGDDSLAERLAREEAKAWMDLNEYELRIGKPNIYDNTSLTSLLSR